MLPLAGFRVLDLSRFLSGPYTTMVLAELGADVVKVERFPEGDDSRRLSPKVNGESYPFGMPNRSKRSISLDLKTDRGRELFLHLAREIDLFVDPEDSAQAVEQHVVLREVFRRSGKYPQPNIAEHVETTVLTKLLADQDRAERIRLVDTNPARFV